VEEGGRVKAPQVEGAGVRRRKWRKAQVEEGASGGRRGWKKAQVRAVQTLFESESESADKVEEGARDKAQARQVQTRK
jgi:hypothetical protein